LKRRNRLNLFDDNEMNEVPKAGIDDEIRSLLGINGRPYSEEELARNRLMMKWLVFYLHPDDYSFMPLALVEAQNEEEACLIALGSGVQAPVAVVDVKARRFTRDCEEGEDPVQVIRCASCNRKEESYNDALCPYCLGLLMGGDIDRIRMIPK